MLDDTQGLLERMLQKARLDSLGHLDKKTLMFRQSNHMLLPSM